MPYERLSDFCAPLVSRSLRREHLSRVVSSKSWMMLGGREVLQSTNRKMVWSQVPPGRNRMNSMLVLPWLDGLIHGVRALGGIEVLRRLSITRCPEYSTPPRDRKGKWVFTLCRALRMYLGARVPGNQNHAARSANVQIMSIRSVCAGGAAQQMVMKHTF